MNRISSFAPIISKDSRILILGSIPGVKSLEMQQYYAHPQNKFWRILFTLFDEQVPHNYSEKVHFLHKKQIAVWDVIDSCERVGSLDIHIKDEIPNDLAELLANHPGIWAVFCNGQKAFKIIQKQMAGDMTVPLAVLPSSSPAHAISFEKKLEGWKVIKTYI